MVITFVTLAGAKVMTMLHLCDAGGSQFFVLVPTLQHRSRGGIHENPAFRFIRRRPDRHSQQRNRQEQADQFAHMHPSLLWCKCMSGPAKIDPREAITIYLKEDFSGFAVQLVQK